MAERPKLYATSITFNDEQTIPLNSNDIVVFVGQNNVGKSQALRDIYLHAANKLGPLVVSKATFSQSTYETVSNWLATHFFVDDDKDLRTYRGMKWSTNQFLVKSAVASGALSDIVDAFLCQLDTTTRLMISQPPEAVARRKQPNHPIHILARDMSLLSKVSSYFKRAFGVGLIPFVGYGKTIPLCVGDDPLIDNREGLTNTQRESYFLKALDAFPQLQDQGDGMRSFAGIMLYLALDFYNVFLIDEPEAFLHPPQATLMGNVIGELLATTQQAFISTHSIHFINGLLEKASNRVKIVRITREGNRNKLSVLDNARLQEISKDPFLKHSLLLEGMFYKNVALCEGDTDCMFYSMINSARDMKGVRSSDTLFAHCGGKQRMSKVIYALKELDVDVKVIPDFDILNEERVLRELVQACDGDWNRVKKEYNVVISDIRQRSNTGTTGAEVLNAVQEELADVLDKVVTPTKIRSLRDMLKSNTEWGRLKQTGISGIGPGNPRQACETMLAYLKSLGIYVVRNGELECFVPTIGGHGPDWLHSVIESFPDTSNGVYGTAKDFVREWEL